MDRYYQNKRLWLLLTGGVSQSLPHAPDIDTLRSSPSLEGKIMIMGGTNRPDRPNKRYVQSEEWTDPSVFIIPHFETTVINIECLDPDKTLIVEGTNPKGVCGDFNVLEMWDEFEDNFFDIVVFDFSTLKSFMVMPPLIAKIIQKIRPGGTFWLEKSWLLEATRSTETSRTGIVEKNLSLLKQMAIARLVAGVKRTTGVKTTVTEYIGMPFKSIRTKITGGERVIKYGYDEVFYCVTKPGH